MQFKEIAEPFNQKGLQLPKLNVLIPDASAYDVLAIQPSGLIGVTDSFVGHGDRQSAEKKFSEFINLAIGTNSDLVISPEYSFPWDVLKAAIRDNKLPAVGKLWVFGCESVTPTEITDIARAFPDIVWIHEPFPNSSGRFLGVVCYLLKTKNGAGQTQDVAILQFKTVPMAGHATFEGDRLILGSTTYVLHNEQNYLQFFSLICSEALEFKVDDAIALRLAQHPSIIFHPQLTLDPRHASIRKYRNDLFSHACSSNLEVISLNWARGFKIGKDSSLYGNSAIFMKSDKFVRSDDRINHNHQRGIYYSCWHVNRTELCILNFDEHIFRFRTKKVYVLGQAVELNRTGPEMVALFQWNGADQKWHETSANDGFKQFCDSYGDATIGQSFEKQSTIVDRERLLTLSAGTLEPILDWHRVEKIRSFVAEGDERSKRLTFLHEQNPDSVEFRKNHLSRYIKLRKTILPAGNFPPSIRDLQDNWEMRPPSKDSDFRFNLAGKSGQVQGAMAIFLGPQPLNFVQQLRHDIVKSWQNRWGDRIEEKTRRLVIWYEDAAANGTIKNLSEPLGTITDDSEPPSSIAKPKNS